VATGLTLPFLTEADPEQSGEGNLDPLRLAPMAEALAEEILPSVTNRMSRVRFLTAISFGSAVSVGLEDIPPKDGLTTPHLAFEWHLVEAIARRSRYGLPDSALLGVPGINKARAVISSGAQLRASTYLKTPKVFGFVGVYKRLANGLALVDQDIVLQSGGDELLRAWERDQNLVGFIDGKRTKPWRLHDIRGAVGDALIKGEVMRSPSSSLWSRLCEALRPDGAGRNEKRTLRRLILDPSSPLRRETIERIARAPAGNDAEVLRAIRREASLALRRRLLAIDAYERVAALLMFAFDTARRMSTSSGLQPQSSEKIARHPNLQRVVRELPSAFARALPRLERIGGYGLDLETSLGRFEAPLAGADFVRELMELHESVQADKQARPWFEDVPQGYFVRSPYTLHLEPELTGAYVHPYRAFAIQSFLADLR
jgi:hypothetical protein